MAKLTHPASTLLAITLFVLACGGLLALMVRRPPAIEDLRLSTAETEALPEETHSQPCDVELPAWVYMDAASAEDQAADFWGPSWEPECVLVEGSEEEIFCCQRVDRFADAGSPIRAIAILPPAPHQIDLPGRVECIADRSTGVTHCEIVDGEDDSAFDDGDGINL